MKLLKTIETILFIAGLGFLFIDWKIGVGLLLLTGVAHAIPYGPDRLLNVIAGSLVLGAVVSLLFDWRISIGLVVLGFSTAAFRIYGNKINREYYGKQQGSTRDPIKKEGSIKSRFETFENMERIHRWMHDNGQFGDKPYPSEEELRKIWDETQKEKAALKR